MSDRPATTHRPIGGTVLGRSGSASTGRRTAQTDVAGTEGPSNRLGNHVLVWGQAETWSGAFSTWLGTRLKGDWRRRLRPGRHREICWDDGAWLDLAGSVLAQELDEVLDDLASELRETVLRVYHGTRVSDAGVFAREGLRVHDRTEMTRRLRALAGIPDGPGAAADDLDRAIADVGNAHDVGRLYVVADERSLLRQSAHYLIYGSEWMLAVSTGPDRRRLRERGTPTLLEIDLPLSMTDDAHRSAFARIMVSEWARLACNGTDWTAPIDFTFTLDVNIPPGRVVGHRHPVELADPIEGYRPYRPALVTCPGCAQAAVDDADG